MPRTINIDKESNQKIVKWLTDKPSKPLDATEDFITQQCLHLFTPDGKITSSVCAEIMKFTEKEKKVKGVCDLSRIKMRPDDNRVYLLVNRRMISSTSYIGLIDKLYGHFFGIEQISMEDFFEIWMQWRDEASGVSKKTIKENRFLWNAFLKGREITKVPLRSLTVQDYISFFRDITKNRAITRKRFNDLKSILNGIQYLAVEQNILASNCLKDINYRQFTYKAENTDVFPYTEEERLSIINHLGSDLYSLAIKFDFYLILRIGELKGLKWDDIHDGFIHIQRFVNDKNEVVEDIKGHQREGKRYIPLLPAAKEILDEVHQLNLDPEYIFFQDRRPLTTVTFNRRLKKCCEELGIEYRSSHKIRFTTASIMHKNGISDTELSPMLGHTTLNMTRHYLRNVTPAEETAEKMRQILQ